jgi:hypothetical protein
MEEDDLCKVHHSHMSRGKRDSYHAKALFRFVKTIPVLFIAFLFHKVELPSKERDFRMLKTLRKT